MNINSLGMLVCPQTPDPKIGLKCGGAFRSNFGSRGNILSHCSRRPDSPDWLPEWSGGVKNTAPFSHNASKPCEWRKGGFLPLPLHWAGWSSLILVPIDISLPAGKRRPMGPRIKGCRDTGGGGEERGIFTLGPYFPLVSLYTLVKGDPRNQDLSLLAAC